MTSSGLLAGVAGALALSGFAVNADAAVIIRNATGAAATDFHIEFDVNVDKLKLTSNRMGAGVTYPPPSPKSKQIDFAGGAGVANGGEMTIEGLGIISLKGKGPLVTSWWWTGGANSQKLDGEPLINVNGTYFNLTTLADKGFGVRAIPEPATWALMILGFGLAGSAVRMRRRRVAAA